MRHFKSIALLLILIAILSGFWAMTKELKENGQATIAASPSPSPLASQSASLPQEDRIKKSSAANERAPAEARDPILAQSRVIAQEKARAAGIAEKDLAYLEENRSPASIQVHYQQKKSGLPLFPRRGMTLTFTTRGELIQVDSQIQPDLKIVNERRLSPEDSRVYAYKALSPADTRGLKISAPLEGGTPVIWTNAVSTARHAYLYHSRGIEIVVDAQSGAILSKRNRRFH